MTVTASNRVAEQSFLLLTLARLPKQLFPLSVAANPPPLSMLHL